LLFSSKSILVFFAFTLALTLLAISAWYFIRSFFIDQKGKDTDKDDLADTVYFISDLENCFLFLFSIVTSATVTALCSMCRKGVIMNHKSEKIKTSIATNITFIVYFLINLIIRLGYTRTQLREDAIKDNTLGKATISDRSHAVMLTGLFFTLWGVIGAVTMGIIVAVLFDNNLFLFWLIMTGSTCLILISAWFYIRLIGIESAGRQWNIGGSYNKAEIALFIGNFELVILLCVSLFLSLFLSTGLTIPALI